MISVIITCLNEQKQLNDTLQSLQATAGGECEVIVVDDCSACRIAAPPFANVIHNSSRCGVGPSRHVGALHATGEWLLLTDSHMRFSPGWLQAIESVARDFRNWNTVYNGVMLGLDESDPDLSRHKGEYFGATFNFLGPDRNRPGKTQFFESVWLPTRPANLEEIPSIMGAVYLINRKWFLELGALRHLRSWGVDEPMLSLKTWLAGGKVVSLQSLRLGHIFRPANKKFPYLLPTSHILYNKLFAAYTLLPPEVATALIAKIPRTSDWHMAMNLIKTDWHLVEIEKAYNASIFVRTFPWFIERFKIPLAL